MSHLGLVAAAKEAVNQVFKDTAVEQETTRESLEELKEFIDECLDALE